MAGFAPTPGTLSGDVNSSQFELIDSMRENIDLLTGLGGDSSQKAILTGQVRVRTMGDQDLQRVTTGSGGFIISGVTVPSESAFTDLLKDVQTLANDLAYTRQVVNTLILQLRDK